MQSKQELENFYKKQDPWDYQITKDDIRRKKEILDILHFPEHSDYENVLDIGCGEGWITKDLPGKNLYGFEISDIASSRFPKNVERVDGTEDREYDLIVCTGVLYNQYDHVNIAKFIKAKASRYVLVGGIKSWLLPYEFGKEIFRKEFKYRDYTQEMILYEVTA